MNEPKPTETTGAPFAPCPGSVASGRADKHDCEDDYWDGENEPICPSCGGEGMVEYLDAGPSVWGEDCPSEENHLVTCPNCRGSGLLKDCSSC